MKKFFYLLIFCSTFSSFSQTEKIAIQKNDTDFSITIDGKNFIINSTLGSIAYALVTNIYIISETNVKDNRQCEGYVI